MLGKRVYMKEVGGSTEREKRHGGWGVEVRDLLMKRAMGVRSGESW